MLKHRHKKKKTKNSRVKVNKRKDPASLIDFIRMLIKKLNTNSRLKN